MQTAALYAAARAAGVDLMWSHPLLPLGDVDVRRYARQGFHGFRTSSVDRSVSFAQDALGSETAKVALVSPASGDLVHTALTAEVLDGGRRRVAITEPGVYRFQGFARIEGGTTSGYVVALPGAFGGLDFLEVTAREARAVLAAVVSVPRQRVVHVLSDSTAVRAHYSLSVSREQVEDALV